MIFQDPKPLTQADLKEIQDRLEILEEHQADLENRLQDLEAETDMNDGDPI